MSLYFLMTVFAFENTCNFFRASLSTDFQLGFWSWSLLKANWQTLRQKPYSSLCWLYQPSFRPVWQVNTTRVTKKHVRPNSTSSKLLFHGTSSMKTFVSYYFDTVMLKHVSSVSCSRIWILFYNLWYAKFSVYHSSDPWNRLRQLRWVLVQIKTRVHIILRYKEPLFFIRTKLALGFTTSRKDLWVILHQIYILKIYAFYWGFVK